MILYAATSNPGKLAEFATSASSAGIDVLALPNLKDIPEPVEDAPTFQGNADLKARAYSLTLPGQLAFADDSGLEVSALDGAPGVRSARFADDYAFEYPNSSVISTEAASQTVVISTEAQRSGETPVFLGSKDYRNNAYLLDLMQRHTSRRARFICTLALARDGEILLRAEGFVEGDLLHAPRGEGGFGYDPLFFLPALGLTMAELSRERKWQLSHRGNAFRSLLAQIAR